MYLDKNVFGWISIAITVAATIPYWRHILIGKIKPHVFTWIIWGVVNAIVAVARDVDHAGPGAWGPLTAAISCLSIAALAYFKGEKNITRGDVISLVVAFAAIPVWLVTNQPLLAVIIVTAIDITGYYPTVRKSFNKPQQEAIYNYVIANIIHILSALANTNYSWTTMLTPVTIFIANSGMIILVLWRRQRVRAQVISRL